MTFKQQYEEAPYYDRLFEIGNLKKEEIAKIVFEKEKLWEEKQELLEEKEDFLQVIKILQMIKREQKEYINQLELSILARIKE